MINYYCRRATMTTIIITVWMSCSHIETGHTQQQGDDGSYKGAHVTIKTISLESVLRLTRRPDFLHGGSRKAEITIVSCGKISRFTVSQLRRLRILLNKTSRLAGERGFDPRKLSADHICVTSGRRAKSSNCNFAHSYRSVSAIKRH